MKKALIIYILFFAATIVVPIVTCIVQKNSGSGQELVNIFQTAITI